MGDLASWFNSLPSMTKWWFGGTIVMSLLGRFGLLSPEWLYLHYGFIYKFHVSIHLFNKNFILQYFL